MLTKEIVELFPLILLEYHGGVEYSFLLGTCQDHSFCLRKIFWVDKINRIQLLPGILQFNPTKRNCSSSTKTKVPCQPLFVQDTSPIPRSYSSTGRKDGGSFFSFFFLFFFGYQYARTGGRVVL